MLLSELISQLEASKAEHGDIPVTLTNWMSGGWMFEEVTTLQVRQARRGLITLGGVRNHVSGLNMDRVSDPLISNEFISQPEYPILVLRTNW